MLDDESAGTPHSQPVDLGHADLHYNLSFPSNMVTCTYIHTYICVSRTIRRTVSMHSFRLRLFFFSFFLLICRNWKSNITRCDVFLFIKYLLFIRITCIFFCFRLKTLYRPCKKKNTPSCRSRYVFYIDYIDYIDIRYTVEIFFRDKCFILCEIFR